VDGTVRRSRGDRCVIADTGLKLAFQSSFRQRSNWMSPTIFTG